MDTTASQAQPLTPEQPETEAARADRIQWEAAVIAQGEAEIDAGLGIDSDDLEAWFDALDRDEDAPLPAPRSVGAASR